MPKGRRTPAWKRDVAESMLEGGATQATVARTLRLDPQTIQNWVVERRRRFPGWPEERDAEAVIGLDEPDHEPAPEPEPEQTTSRSSTSTPAATRVWDPYFGWVSVGRQERRFTYRPRRFDVRGWCR